MATNFTGQTIAATYEKIIKRQNTYSATGNRIEIQNDSAVSLDTALYLPSHHCQIPSLLLVIFVNY